ncbi:hypothetical protein C8R46DRAFT_1121485 [Mycena filopes]|nr:hypothetical protein C8R46DRAFT_1121485 [Mycena filopes]
MSSSSSDVFDHSWLWESTVNLFILAIHILRRRKAAGNTILLTSTCLMCTGVPQAPPRTYNTLILAHALVLALYRCYVIWGARWIVIVLPGILIVATFRSAGAIRPEGPVPGELILGIAANLLLLILIVGQIWRMRRNALHVSADRVLIDRYTHIRGVYIVPAILITIVYPWNIPFHSIIPTVIIVRVGLGRSIHDTIERRVTRHRIEGIHAQSQVRSAGPVSLPVLEIKADEEKEGAESIV